VHSLLLIEQPFLYFSRQRHYEARARARPKFNLTGCARSALQSMLERSLKCRGEASVHFEELLAAPSSIQLILWLVQKEQITESHGRAAWRSGAG